MKRRYPDTDDPVALVSIWGVTALQHPYAQQWKMYGSTTAQKYGYSGLPKEIPTGEFPDTPVPPPDADAEREAERLGVLRQLRGLGAEELDAAQLYARGFSPKHVAKSLGISVKVARTRLRRIRVAFGAEPTLPTRVCINGAEAQRWNWKKPRRSP